MGIAAAEFQDRKVQEEVAHFAQQLRALAEQTHPLYDQASRLPSYLDSERRAEAGEENPLSVGWQLAGMLESTYNDLLDLAEQLERASRLTPADFAAWKQALSEG
jgi:hypothetical protein